MSNQDREGYSETEEPERVEVGRSQLFLATCMVGSLIPVLGAVMVVGWALLQVGAWIALGLSVETRIAP